MREITQTVAAWHGRPVHTAKVRGNVPVRAVRFKIMQCAYKRGAVPNTMRRCSAVAG